MHFPREVSTNNTAEYEGLLAGLRIAADLGIKAHRQGRLGARRQASQQGLPEPVDEGLRR